MAEVCWNNDETEEQLEERETFGALQMAT